jgi:DNA-binding XRE family transcriptional regulator
MCQAFSGASWDQPLQNTSHESDKGHTLAGEQRGVLVADLRGWRRHATLTQEQLAARAGVSRLTVLHAERHLPISIPNVQALAKALGMSVQQLRFDNAPQDNISR